MIVTREGIIQAWLKKGVKVIPHHVDLICGWPTLDFPDLATLSPDEKKLLRPVLQRRSDILEHEIQCSKRVQ
jgi:hypothetical protein